MGKKTTTAIISLLALAGVYGICSTAQVLERAEKEVALDRKAREQERAMRRKTNPDFGRNGINNRISKEIAQKGVLRGYICPDTNIDTATSYDAEKNKPADMYGFRAGLTHAVIFDTLIDDPNKYKNIRISIPKHIPNRYQDSQGR